MNETNEDLDYIKKFSKITIVRACKEAGVTRQNLWTGKTSKNNIKRVRKYLESNVAELYMLKDDEKNGKNNNTL